MFLVFLKVIFKLNLVVSAGLSVYFVCILLCVLILLIFFSLSSTCRGSSFWKNKVTLILIWLILMWTKSSLDVIYKFSGIPYFLFKWFYYLIVFFSQHNPAVLMNRGGGGPPCKACSSRRVLLRDSALLCFKALLQHHTAFPAIVSSCQSKIWQREHDSIWIWITVWHNLARPVIP